jgi:aspartate kinase
MKAHINLMQNSALNFSVLVDRNKIDVEQLREVLGSRYLIKYNEHLELVTIRHYNDDIVKQMSSDKTTLVSQLTRTTARLVLQAK